MPSIVNVLPCVVSLSHWTIEQHWEGKGNRNRGEEQKVNEIRFDRTHRLMKRSERARLKDEDRTTGVRELVRLVGRSKQVGCRNAGPYEVELFKISKRIRVRQQEGSNSSRAHL